MKPHPAHIRFENGVEIIQTVAEHARKVAAYCAKNLEGIGLSSLGYLIGLLHDIGKTIEKFADYIRRSAAGENVRRGSVNHTFAGVIWLFLLFHGKGDSLTDATCELIAYAVGAHHGLFDCISQEGRDGFLHRLEKDRDEIAYGEAIENFQKECADETEIRTLFEQACLEVQLCWKKVIGMPGIKKSALGFQAGMLARMILSALIDADRRDAAEFDLGERQPELPEDPRPVWTSALERLEDKLSQFKPEGNESIYEARQKISQTCRDFPAQNGVYRLTVPTGSGKTLSALRFALARGSESRQIKRIFYVAPLLSILDQNADVIRKYVGNDGMILEHHSNLINEDDPGQDELLEQEKRRRELLCENWNAPIIITTTVQLLNTLFDARTSCVRRMHALCGSVLILDEVQALPQKLISMTNEALNFFIRRLRGDRGDVFGDSTLFQRNTAPATVGRTYGHRLV